MSKLDEMFLWDGVGEEAEESEMQIRKELRELHALLDSET